nr:MAG TPA: hypothetical protein [Caudoviricetes sp.]
MPAGTSLNVNKSKLFQHFVIHAITSLLSEQYSTDSGAEERKEVTENGFRWNGYPALRHQAAENLFEDA